MSFNYTIIIPHHNLPHLLYRCLSSIPNRNDIQTIVIDDKSDEQYIQYLKEIESQFVNVSFYYLSECSGAGKARNIGLKKALGKYILFADSDDFFNYCIHDILNEYKGEDADIIYFNANSLDTDSYIQTRRNEQLSGMIREYSRNQINGLFKLRYIFGEPWCKMVKHEIIKSNNIKFEETNIHNDTAYSYLVGYYSKKAKVDNRCLYCVTDRVNSVSRQISLERLLTRTEVFSNANKFFREHHINRFEERALRPMMQFLLKGNWEYYNKCRQIIINSGISSNELIIKQLFYPLLVLKKVYQNFLYKLI